MMGVVFLAQAAASMLPPVVMGAYDDTSWPASYQCKVLTDRMELIEFQMRLTEREAVLDTSVAPFSAGKPIALERVLRAPKRGEKYARGMREVRGSDNQFWVFQSGVPDHSITSLSFQAGKWDRPATEAGPLASGFCSVLPDDMKKARTQ